jgi:hypothetical protein
MDSYRIIIMVLAADIAGYNKLIDSIKNTWAKYLPPGYKVLYYYGYRDGHTLIGLRDDSTSDG